MASTLSRTHDFSYLARITSREQLMAMLGEASEVEHTLMCCYLYAAFSLKSDPSEGLTDEQAEALARWRREIIAIAVEEMSHLAIVANLLSAVGGAAHFFRLNFPIARGALPASMNVHLAPFDMATLEHFIYLERPENSKVQDSGRFDDGRDYSRSPLAQSRLMPVSYDYETVGTLYASIAYSLDVLTERYGEEHLFVGDAARQVGRDIAPLPGLCTIRNLDEAKAAIETIVGQGEGAPNDCGHGHFSRFSRIKTEYEAFLAEDPGFSPGRAVAENPVMRRPPSPEGKVWITHPEAAKLIDYVNAVYIMTLRLLTQAFGRPGAAEEKRVLVSAATDLMYAMTPAAEELTTLPARQEDDVRAGMSFAMVRSMAPLPMGTEWNVFTCRFNEITEAGTELREIGPKTKRSVDMIEGVAKTFARRAERILERADEPTASVQAVATNVDAPEERAAAAENTAAASPGQPERVEGKDVILSFDGRRCIHARFCVTGAPRTFLANVDGPWLHPNETSADLLQSICHQCPSGAITVRRKDGGWEEKAPSVNVVRVRENGPLAFHADLRIDGEPDGYRRTLCRCGASKSKPYCDGSHVEIGFEASGEPPTREMDSLPRRDGPLQIEPLVNGPLEVTGALEICAGTGRGVRRTESVRLCRCGASRSKPYCDNSHARIGFRSES